MSLFTTNRSALGHRHRETLMIKLLSGFCLLCLLFNSVSCQQLTRPIIISSNSPPQPSQQQQQQQYYAALNQASKSTSPRPPPPPSPPSQIQLQQQYQQQQNKQSSYRQPVSAPQIVYQKPQAQIQPQRNNQLRGPPANRQQLENEASYEYEDEENEPDRLTQLLVNSKFQCSSKKDGYYADESLNCEVFHYCQDNVKHSWMCPNQFMFHQVHLICVPPSTENICKQSSQFHFVNEYLYRPVNAKEASSNSNVSLRYADRYYPEGYAHGDPLNEQYLIEASQRSSVATNAPSSSSSNSKKQQVYFSADSVNIPLNQRRPSIAPPARQPLPLSSDEYYDD